MNTDKNQLSDEDLIVQFQDGDEIAFNILCERYQDKLFNFIFRFVYDAAEAEDLTQDTLLKVYIKKHSYWSIGSASLKEIEKLNILKATLLAMKRAIKKLKIKPKQVLIDGNKLPKMKNYNLKYVIKGDQKIPEISAASIIAKVSRDRLISKMGKKYVKYSWSKNAGYGTKHHLFAIKKFGITKHHRKTFQPIHNILRLK